MLIPGHLSLCVCDRLLKWDSTIRGQVRRRRMFHEHKNMLSSVSLTTGSKSSYRPGEMEGSEIQGGWGKPEPWKVLSEHLPPCWQTREGSCCLGLCCVPRKADIHHPLKGVPATSVIIHCVLGSVLRSVNLPLQLERQRNEVTCPSSLAWSPRLCLNPGCVQHQR